MGALVRTAGRLGRDSRPDIAAQQGRHVEPAIVPAVEVMRKVLQRHAAVPVAVAPGALAAPSGSGAGTVLAGAGAPGATELGRRIRELVLHGSDPVERPGQLAIGHAVDRGGAARRRSWRRRRWRPASRLHHVRPCGGQRRGRSGTRLRR